MKHIILLLTVFFSNYTLHAQTAEEYFLQGNEAGKQNSYREAIEAFQKAIQLKPDYPEAYSAIGITYLRMENYNQALDAYKQAIQINPEYAEAYYGLGFTFYTLENYPEASQAFLKTTQLKKDYTQAFYMLGQTYNDLEKYTEAVESFQKGIDIQEDGWAYRNMALNFYKLEEYEKGIQAYTRAIELDSTDYQAYRGRAIHYYQLGKYENVIEDYDKALAIKPEDRELQFAVPQMKGMAYENMGEYEKSIESFRKAIRIDPTNPLSYSIMGQAYDNSGKYEEAIEAFRKTLELDPGNTEARLRLKIAQGKKNNLIHKQTKQIDKMLAIVVGNDYEPDGYEGQSRLPTAIHDATEVAARLKELNFDTFLYTNSDYEEMNHMIQKLDSLSDSYQLILFYYAGHGIQLQGKNYLLPVNVFEKITARNVHSKCIRIDEILTRMNTVTDQNYKMKIMILDACRDNQFGDKKGLAKIEPVFTGENDLGTLIEYATEDNNTAEDSYTEKNSPYTQELLVALNEYLHLDVERMFKLIRKNVQEKTKGKQRPMSYSGLTQDFYFIKSTHIH